MPYNIGVMSYIII